MKRFPVLIVLTILIVTLISSCTYTSRQADTPPDNDDKKVEKPVEDTDKDQKEPKKEIDLQAIKPNETGKIMVLMYHEVGNNETEWARKWENFKKDLEVLYQKGYRLISLNDYLDNNIDVEAGYTPVVITFDDATRGQFNIIEENGEPVIDPNCAVGIMENMYEEHPDFGLEATFYIYYPLPFRQKEHIEFKLKYLVEKGMDIGNHTYNHANLGKLDPEGIQYQLGRMAAETNQYLPGYNVNSLALPFGVNSKEEYRDYVYSGEYEGVKYQNHGILLVGANPAPSPVDRKFNPYKIPRVRATDSPNHSTDMYDWLEYFDEHPDRRYVSDGDPDTVTIPEELKDRVDEEKLGDKQLRVYNLK